MTSIRVHSGTYVSLDHPSPESIQIADIAHALSNIARYTGHTKSFYSVAQHSVLASQIALIRYDDRDLAYSMLLHDAHEAYLGDVSAPLKRLLGRTYEDLVDRFDAIISSKFDVDLRHDLIHVIDRNMGLTEARLLLDVDITDDYWPEGDVYDLELVSRTPEAARRDFEQALKVIRKLRNS